MARKWESIICYEDRADHLTTSRWRLAGVRTKEGALNTDDGVLWLKTTKSGDTVTANVYKDAGLASLVISGTANVANCDNTGENAVEVTLTAQNTSGLSGSFWIHNYEGDDNCPVQVALCVDEDLDSLYADIENHPDYDATAGLAEFIRVSCSDVIGKVLVLFRDQLVSYGAPEAWYITDADRTYPDLRRIANPDQLRLAAAHHALEIALGSRHDMAQDTMYSNLRDYHRERYKEAMESLQLAFKHGSGDDANTTGISSTIHLDRV